MPVTEKRWVESWHVAEDDFRVWVREGVYIHVCLSTFFGAEMEPLCTVNYSRYGSLVLAGFVGGGVLIGITVAGASNQLFVDIKV
jgi:hypothetical protein